MFECLSQTNQNAALTLRFFSSFDCARLVAAVDVTAMFWTCEAVNNANVSLKIAPTNGYAEHQKLLWFFLKLYQSFYGIGHAINVINERRSYLDKTWLGIEFFVVVYYT